MDKIIYKVIRKESNVYIINDSINFRNYYKIIFKEYIKKTNMGPFINYVRMILAISDPLPPCKGG